MKLNYYCHSCESRNPGLKYADVISRISTFSAPNMDSASFNNKK